MSDQLDDFLARGLAAQRAVDEAIAEASCGEKWYDEVGCAATDGVHRCREVGVHRTHRCISCGSLALGR